MFTRKKDYAYWIEKFYQGSMLIPGWNSIKEQILAVTPEHEQKTIAQRVDNLGERISREWAQDNENRAISSSHLQLWGKNIKDAQAQGYEPLKETLATIEAEVDKLLSQA
ncbi:hypothetical protein ACFL27_07690 [candidate division CSSED10-310 bacterium]|uniref:Uncharacterized protein n=1 Tax=candidate division CSSED10-310 bacterium TaxID=2855610 RepID=A0ABV6YV28_UNCC1